MKALLYILATISMTAFVVLFFDFVAVYENLISGGEAALTAVLAVLIGVPATYGAAKIESKLEKEETCNA